MQNKNENILIRLDGELKDKFRLYCDSQRQTMTDILIQQIKLILSNADNSDSTNNINLIKKERDFYKCELELFRETYIDIDKLISSINREHRENIDKHYISLILERFYKIKEFDGYELINNNIKDSWPDILAKNSKDNFICIEVRFNLRKNAFSSNYVKMFEKKCKQYGSKEKVKLIFLVIQNLDDFSYKLVEQIQKIIGYEASIFRVEDLLYK